MMVLDPGHHRPAAPPAAPPAAGLQRLLELAQRLDTRGPRYTSYPTVPVWRDLDPRALGSALGAVTQAARPVAIYVHLPFCAIRCLYCGCNSFITHSEGRIERYARALETEVDRVADALGGAVPHSVLHLGGGTPTHLPPALLAPLLDQLLRRFPVQGGGAADGLAPGVERSVEVDPRACTDEHLELFAARGFRRISIGVQDVDEAVQQAVRRIQPMSMLRDFVRRARSAGFTAVNIDLIYGLPRQTPETWRASLAAVLDLDPDRLACFGYAHLPERIAHQRAIDAETLPGPDTRIEMLLEAQRFLCEHGYEAVGMDHFAKSDDELSRARRDGRLWRNFMGYTPHRKLELLGLGCSAISELREVFAQNESAPEKYNEMLAAGRSPVVRGHLLDADDRYRKALINDLMCNLEIRPDVVAAAEGLPVPDAVARALEGLAPFANEGMLERTRDGWRVTSLGQLFLRNIAMPFDRYLPEQGGTNFSRTV
ncbi:MAG: oxygen-independent coproporphyrinogen III oxidase [Myxococcales bacterium]|nr:oxygen-independent coproporphyrinogen III oxidase [Myxococcales bacterium]